MPGARGWYARVGKRWLDVVVSLIVLLVTLPLGAVVAAAVRVSLGRPVLFRQRRPGRHGAPFAMYKFRTMTDTRAPDGRRLPDGARLTPFGSWLRSTSLDEWPELLNVLAGDMSLVGPRPLLMHYLERYSAEQMRRHDVRPGITGWAQVNGRNALGWPDRFALDVWYVDHVSLSLDLRILLRTVWTVVQRQGIAAPGRDTMDEFPGNG